MRKRHIQMFDATTNCQLSIAWPHIYVFSFLFIRFLRCNMNAKKWFYNWIGILNMETFSILARYLRRLCRCRHVSCSLATYLIANQDSRNKRKEKNKQTNRSEPVSLFTFYIQANVSLYVNRISLHMICVRVHVSLS